MPQTPRLNHRGVFVFKGQCDLDKAMLVKAANVK
ncbi:hypothetical protein VITU102760_11645 [Vibrio tubiashii]